MSNIYDIEIEEGIYLHYITDNNKEVQEDIKEKCSTFLASLYKYNRYDINHPYFTFKDGCLYENVDHTLLYVDKDKTGYYKIPSDIKRIKENVFNGCALEEIEMEEHVQFPRKNLSIYKPFRDCKNLKKVTLHSKTRTVPSYFFNDRNTFLSVLSYLHPNQVEMSDRGEYLYEIYELMKSPTTTKEWKDEWLQNFKRKKACFYYYIVKDIRALALFLDNKLLNLENIKALLKICNDEQASSEVINAILEYEKNNYTEKEIIRSTQREYKCYDINSATYIRKNFNYRFDSEGNAVITGYIGEGEDVIVPKAINKHPVVSISRRAFSPNNTRINKKVQNSRRCIKSINLPPSIKQIESAAFNSCTKLESLRLPPSVKFDSFYAHYLDKKLFTFEFCDSLKEIKLEGDMPIIPDRLFIRCTGLEKIIFPDSVKVIEKMCFAFCESLKEVTLPPNIERVSVDSFVHCPKLKSLVFPERTKEGGFMFTSECQNMEELVFLNPKTRIILYNCSLRGNCIIKGYKGSSAEEIANDKNIPFVPLD